MRADGVGLNDVIGGEIGRLPMDEQNPRGFDCYDDNFLAEWGAEPEDTKPTESQP